MAQTNVAPGDRGWGKGLVKDLRFANDRARHPSEQREVIDPQREIEGFFDRFVHQKFGLQLEDLGRFLSTTALLF